MMMAKARLPDAHTLCSRLAEVERAFKEVPALLREVAELLLDAPYDQSAAECIMLAGRIDAMFPAPPAAEPGAPPAETKVEPAFEQGWGPAIKAAIDGSNEQVPAGRHLYRAASFLHHAKCELVAAQKFDQAASVSDYAYYVTELAEGDGRWQAGLAKCVEQLAKTQREG